MAEENQRILHNKNKMFLKNTSSTIHIGDFKKDVTYWLLRNWMTLILVIALKKTKIFF